MSKVSAPLHMIAEEKCAKDETQTEVDWKFISGIFAATFSIICHSSVHHQKCHEGSQRRHTDIVLIVIMIIISFSATIVPVR